MSARRYVNQTGSSLSLRWVALATSMVATVAYGYFVGVIEVIQSAQVALVTALDGIGEFSETLVFELLAGPAEVIETAWSSNAAFLSEFGLLAYPIAMVEMAVVIYLLVAGTTMLIRGVT